MILELPYPPSMNTYWRHTAINGRAKVYISKEGLIYRQNVQTLTNHIKQLEGGLKISVELNPPDKRLRDIDNPIKCLFDSLQHAGVVKDDSQFDELFVKRGQQYSKGRVLVEITQIN